MGTGYIFKTDLYALHNIVQNAMLSYAKELIIETLREEFSKDSYYHYVRDAWGFPKRPDLTDVPIEAGLDDDQSSRIFIGEAFSYDMKFYPAILVRSASMKYVPISMSRNEGLVKYTSISVLDGYGNEKIYATPDHFSLAGAWEGSLSIEIIAGDIKARDEILEIVSAILTITNFKSMTNAGVIVKPISIGSSSEATDYQDKIYKQTISADIRTEWRQEIPIETTLDAITFCVDFGNTETQTFAENIEINTLIELIDSL